ncbi:hypothetical protein MTP99_007478 [Tenebrio molitor]|nr:hypothetical protein MTP99_007478 [Tenebrio molitor]
MKHGCLQMVPCEGHGKMKMCVQLRKFQEKERDTLSYMPEIKMDLLRMLL